VVPLCNGTYVKFYIICFYGCSPLVPPPPTMSEIIKSLGNQATLLCDVYGYCTNAMSTLCCIVTWGIFEVATRVCCRFTCKHLSLLLLFNTLVPFRWLFSVEKCPAIVSIRCSAYILLTLLACLCSSYRAVSGSSIFYRFVVPIICTTIDAFVLFSGGSAFPQLVPSST